MRQGDIGNAMLAYEAAVQKDPQDAKAWCRLGLAHAENEKDQLAMQAFSKCLEIDAGNKEVRNKNWSFFETYIFQALLALSVSQANEGMENEALHQLDKWMSSYMVCQIWCSIHYLFYFRDPTQIKWLALPRCTLLSWTMTLSTESKPVSLMLLVSKVPLPTQTFKMRSASFTTWIAISSEQLTPWNWQFLEILMYFYEFTTLSNCFLRMLVFGIVSVPLLPMEIELQRQSQLIERLWNFIRPMCEPGTTWESPACSCLLMTRQWSISYQPWNSRKEEMTLQAFGARWGMIRWWGCRQRL